MIQRLDCLIGRKLARCAAVVSIACLTACATSPLGRSQLILFPEAQLAQMGALAYKDMRAQTPISKDGKASDYVNCVAQAIIEANPELDAYQWEVTLFESEQANAFALPGGKLGVYSGMLGVAVNQHQLAAVMGHELAHVTARHGNERVSTNFATQTGLQVAAIAAGAGSSPQKAQLFGLLGLGAQVGVMLPFGRAQETESDLLGLDYMAKAGFDPSEASQLWRNMSAQGGARQPTFLSTHPAPEMRIRKLDERAPAAQALRREARAAGRSPVCD
ncbi:MAG: M48 family metallopeptidase [Pseudomonadota bacterium]